MRYTKKRNGVNEIPLLNAVCGIDIPYWRIDRADDLHSYLSGDAADKLAAYEDAEEQGLLVIPHWIPVTERLPEENVAVLTWGEQAVVLIDWHRNGKWFVTDGVTHWMPLPDPPKEE